MYYTTFHLLKQFAELHPNEFFTLTEEEFNHLYSPFLNSYAAQSAAQAKLQNSYRPPSSSLPDL